MGSLDAAEELLEWKKTPTLEDDKTEAEGYETDFGDGAFFSPPVK